MMHHEQPEALAQSLAACKTIASAEERLACYDRLAEPPPVPTDSTTGVFWPACLPNTTSDLAASVADEGEAAGADFVKTSTGFGPGGATVADVATAINGANAQRNRAVRPNQSYDIVRQVLGCSRRRSRGTFASARARSRTC